VLSGRGLCDELITHPEDSYRLWCVDVCDLENLKNKEAMTRVGSQRHSTKKIYILHSAAKFKVQGGCCILYKSVTYHIDFLQYDIKYIKSYTAWLTLILLTWRIW